MILGGCIYSSLFLSILIYILNMRDELLITIGLQHYNTLVFGCFFGVCVFILTLVYKYILYRESLFSPYREEIINEKI